MKFVADENIPRLSEAFGVLGEVTALPGRGIQAADLNQADCLLVRSVTRVDEALLAGSPVRFVASATIGEDHIDKDWLAEQGIGFASAPGCNADSAAEYVLTVILQLQRLHGNAWRGRSVGIIGCGNVGSRVRRKLTALGMHCIINDPPRQAAGIVDQYHSLDEVLACDFVSLHVPLVLSGEWPTYHLLAEEQLRSLRSGCVLINTSRGSAIDNQALNRLLAEEVRRVVLDVWEGEPSPMPELLQRVTIASPHIAGYSLEGRLRGTEMIHHAVCDFFGLDTDSWSPWSSLEPVSLEINREMGLSDAVLSCYDVMADDAKLRALLDVDVNQRGGEFDKLRKYYPLRREFASYEPLMGVTDTNLRDELLGIGFRLTD